RDAFRCASGAYVFWRPSGAEWYARPNALVELRGLDERVERRGAFLWTRRGIGASGAFTFFVGSVGVWGGGIVWVPKFSRGLPPGCRGAGANDSSTLLGCREAHVCGHAG